MINKGHIPIYKLVSEFYRSRIKTQKIKPGSRIDSINRIMERHKVSRDTAKRVIKILVDEKLVISQLGKGTFVRICQEIVPKWGMVIPFFSSTMEQLISHMMSQAGMKGKTFTYYLHYNNPEEEMRLIGQMISEGYESVVVVPNYDETLTADFYRTLMSGGTRIILADNTMAGSYFNYVIQSYDLGIKRALDYLCSKTSGNILLLGNNTWNGKNLVFELMEQTMGMILLTEFPGREIVMVSSATEVTSDYIKKNNITGVISTQDSNTIRLIGRLKKWGYKIPEQVSLVSYGNTELTKYFTPSITAIDCNYKKMAELIATMSGKDIGINEQHVLSPTLIQRKT